MSDVSVNEGTELGKPVEDVFSSAFDSAVEPEPEKKEPGGIEPEPSPDPLPEPVVPDVKAESEQTYEQRWKSLNGILKSTKEQFESEKTTLATELKTLKETLASLTSKPATKAIDDLDLSDDDKEALAEYEKDFDVVAKMEGKRRDIELKKLRREIEKEFAGKFEDLKTQFTSQLNPLVTNFQSSEQARHFNAIGYKHPDYEQYRDDGSIQNWIATKPRYMQESMKKTYSEGAADDVIDLISDFKREHNLLNETTNQPRSNVVDMRKAEKKQALTAVSSKRTAVNQANHPADDFDSAFDEALRK